MGRGSTQWGLHIKLNCAKNAISKTVTCTYVRTCTNTHVHTYITTVYTYLWGRVVSGVIALCCIMLLCLLSHMLFIMYMYSMGILSCTLHDSTK